METSIFLLTSKNGIVRAQLICFGDARPPFQSFEILKYTGSRRFELGALLCAFNGLAVALATSERHYLRDFASTLLSLDG
jgi:hypothetical protein